MRRNRRRLSNRAARFTAASLAVFLAGEPCRSLVQRSLLREPLLASAALAQAPAAEPTNSPANTVSVELKLRTGGAISGLVVEHDDQGLVIVHDKKPYAFAWNEIEPGKSYVARRKLLVLERGGEGKLSAQDFFDIGLFALRVGRNDLASDEFARAKRLDRSFEPRILRAFDEFRERQAMRKTAPHDPFDDTPDAEPNSKATHDGPTTIDPPTASIALPTVDETSAATSTDELRPKVMEAYRTFGAKVQETLGKDVVLLETEHFLIWTDWDTRERTRLVEWSEAMYAALGDQFALNPSTPVFLAKCPMFGWKNKASFRKFARYFDGHSGDNAVGYTRSIEKSGHVHVVLVRQGNSPDDLDRFASTLVHEGTHAFLHRLYSARLIPHWVNEGFANYIAERVLGDRCNNAETAALLARPYVRYDWPIDDFLRDAGPIAVEQYPLAHSIVAYLLNESRDRFTGFIRNLKDGRSLPDALAANYDGLSIADLELRWREWVRRTDRSPHRSEPRP